MAPFRALRVFGMAGPIGECQTERAPLLRFLVLSALAGWVALSGFAIFRTIPLWRWNWVRRIAWSNASPLRFSASRRDRFSPECDDREMLCSPDAASTNVKVQRFQSERASSVLRARAVRNFTARASPAKLG